MYFSEAQNTNRKKKRVLVSLDFCQCSKITTASITLKPADYVCLFSNTGISYWY